MTCSQDNSLGPGLAISATPLPGCRPFDFTIAFEDVVFWLLPSILMVPVATLCIWRTVTQPLVEGWTMMSIAKLTLSIALAALQLAQICLFASAPQASAARYTLPAISFVLLAVTSMGSLSAVNQVRSSRPSLVVEIYLFLTLLPDAARVRTTWLISGACALAVLQAVALVVKLGLLVLEPFSRRFRTSNGSRHPPEETAGFFNRSLLLWLNPLFMRGYRHELSVDDLPPLGGRLSSARLTEVLSEAWWKTRPSRRRRLALSLARAFWPRLLLVQLPRFALVGFAISQPLLLETTLHYVRDHEFLATKRGQALVGAFALDYVAIALSTVWYQHLAFRLLTMIRGSLIGMVFRHSLALPMSSLGTGAEAVSLMNTDMDRITSTLQWVLNIIPDVVQVAVALYILEQRLGSVFVAPIVVSIVCAAVTSQVGKRIPARQRRWMLAIQKRVGVTSGVISSIKGIKFSSLTDVVSRKIQDSRVAEIGAQKSFRHLQIAGITLGNTPAMLTPAVTLCAFAIAQLASGGPQFDAATAFTSLSLLVIMVKPIAELVTAATNLISALSCLDRIQEFLQKEPLKSIQQLDPSLSEDQRDTSTISAISLEGHGHESSSIVLSALGSHPSENAHRPLLRIVRGSFGYDDNKAILKDIDIEVQQSSLLLVVGPVGSGKSTLLRSLLGETRILAGTLESVAPKQLSYCDQEPWILNTSIKQNILGVTEIDSDRYHRVLGACQLLKDLEELPLGDETLAGSKGISLSGGQKARIGLARAAYSRKDIAIIDDSLGGLDPVTAAACFRALLGPSGMFKEEGRTVVFATNNLQWVASSDHVAVLGLDGRMAATGMRKDVTQTNAYLIGLMHERKEKSNRQMESGEIKARGITTVAASALVESPPAASPDSQEEEEETGSDYARAQTNLSALRYYMSLMNKGALLVFIVLVFLHIGASTAQPMWLKYWAASSKDNPGSPVSGWIGVYIAFAVATIMFIAIQTGFFFISIAPKLSINLHRRLLDATMKAPLSFFVTQSTGVIVNLFTGDLNLSDLRLPGSFLLTSEKIALVIAEVVLTSLASGYLALTIPLLAIILYLLQRIYLASSRQLRVLELELKAPLLNSMMDAAAGLATIRAFSWTAETERANTRLLDNSQQPYYLLFCLQRWLTLVLDLVTAGLAALIVGLAVILRDTMDEGFLGVALVSVMSFGSIVGALIMHWTNLETSLGAIRRIADYVDTAAADSDASQGPDNVHTVVDERWPAAGSIRISNVATSYGSRRVLQDINLTFLPGQKTAICGRTGSGKSTLLGLIMRLSPVDQGNIYLDDTDISHVPPGRLEQAIASLPQDPVLLEGSVRHNLDPWGRHVGGDEALLEDLQKVGLADLVRGKGGLDVELNADWLSIGQRQLFCFARVMLRRCRVLLLDEATSCLDKHAEEVVYKLLRTEFKDCTIVAVTHRVRFEEANDWPFDQVVVMEDGKVAEVGSPPALMGGISGGLFQQLVDSQLST